MLLIFFRSYRQGHRFSIVSVIVFSTLFFSVATSKLHAQKLTENVVNGFGGTVSTQGTTFDFVVGEMAVSTFEAGGYIISQGFLQPIELKIPCGVVTLKAYPNPVLERIKIYAEGCDIEVAMIKTYDLLGKLVYEGKPINNEISFASIGVGVYVVRAYNEYSQEVGVVKILKSTI